ncbi:MAG: RNA-binding domain-containing protein [Acidobacteriota bacterium]
MTRSRKFRSARRTPESERSLFEQKITGRYSRTLDRTDLLSLVRGGEDTHVEFKIRLVNTEKVTAEIVAMANTGGGALLFGVNDHRRVEGLDDPEQVEQQLIDICRNQIRPPVLPRIDKVAFDNGTRIVVLQVDDRRAPHFTPDHRYFIRIGSTKREADGSEIAALFARSHNASFEDMPLVASDIADLDEALVWSYARDLEGELFQQPTGFPTANVLADLRLAIDYGAILTPTLAGFLLFGRSEAVESVVAQNKLTLARFSGRDANAPVVEQAEVRGNLTRIFDRALSFIRRYADLWDARPQRSSHTGPVPARANYPRQAVIEALTNMIAHRDYAMVEPSSRVSVFDDRIEFINPSRASLGKKSIEMGAISRPNPRIHHLLTRPEYGLESAPRGIPALRRAHFAFARREPRITTLGDEFHLELVGI